MAIIEKVPAVPALTALNPLGRQQCSQHMPAAFPTVTQITAAVTSKQRVDGHVDNQYLNILYLHGSMSLPQHSATTNKGKCKIAGTS